MSQNAPITIRSLDAGDRTAVRRPRFAGAAAALAVFIALGGSSYAAVAISGVAVSDSAATAEEAKSRYLLDALAETRPTHTRLAPINQARWDLAE